MNIPHHLIQQVLAGKAILFLGAGASYGATSKTPPTAPPLGRQLGDLLSDKFLGGDSKDKPLTMIAEYCIDATDLRTVQRYIADVFNNRPLPGSKIAGSEVRFGSIGHSQMGCG